MGTVLSLFDIPNMHTVIDDLIRWIYRTFLKREWSWPVQPNPEEQPRHPTPLDSEGRPLWRGGEQRADWV